MHFDGEREGFRNTVLWTLHVDHPHPSGERLQGHVADHVHISTRCSSKSSTYVPSGDLASSDALYPIASAFFYMNVVIVVLPRLF